MPQRATDSTPSTAATARPSGKWLALPAILVVIVVVVLTLFVVSRKDPATAAVDNALAETAADMQKALPQPFAPGLVLEKVAVERRVLVFTIRSTKVHAQQARENLAALGRIRELEQNEMNSLCDNPRMKTIFANGAGAARRFIDTDGKVFFEVSLSAETCRTHPPSP